MKSKTFRISNRFLLLGLVVIASAWVNLSAAPIKVGTFSLSVRTVIGRSEGLMEKDVLSVVALKGNQVYAGTARGLCWRNQGNWQSVEGLTGDTVGTLTVQGEVLWCAYRGSLYSVEKGKAEKIGVLPRATLHRMIILEGGAHAFLATDQGLFIRKGGQWVLDPVPAAAWADSKNIFDIALDSENQLVIAAEVGLFRRSADGHWSEIQPRQGKERWAPVDVRALVLDRLGRLWFACPQGVGSLQGKDWRLYQGKDGLPYHDFSCAAAGESGVVWFGTSKGAIRYDGEHWEYREGMRWLPGDEVRSIAVEENGNAWIATNQGIALIERRDFNLSQKADFYESAIDKRHRRTPYGYVLGVSLLQPGDDSRWLQQDSDNDGLWTSMYGAAECFAFAATGDPRYEKRAREAWHALHFLGEVTQGGEHPAPKGFVARTVLPADQPNPNAQAYTKEKDERHRDTLDKYWKVMVPRWPLSADRKWYWKCDTSSDELDGHYFFYGRYFDLVAQTPGEKQRVAEHVRALTDHLIEHNFTLTDWDQKPTRWAVFNPEALNEDPMWYEERGMNSLSMLSYLATAYHITQEGKYLEVSRHLIQKHNYAINALNHKTNAGPGSGNQSDDEMVFMCLYNLLQYERDPGLREIYAQVLKDRWSLERLELNPFFNYIAASQLASQPTIDELPIALSGSWREESIDTLKRFPLDLMNWRIANSHRLDIVVLPKYASDERSGGMRGHLRDGRVLPIDERYVDHWNQDPWQLDYRGDGRYLADGASYLLPYYMGLYHQFIEN